MSIIVYQNLSVSSIFTKLLDHQTIALFQKIKNTGITTGLVVRVPAKQLINMIS
jgi:hypothetical protein